MREDYGAVELRRRENISPNRALSAETQWAQPDAL